MNDSPIPTRRARRKAEGMGCKRKRVEDVRFTQGKGNYVDDIKLPGMLYGDFIRSPLRPCADQIDRHVEGAGRARRAGGADRRGPEAAQPRLDADARPATCRRCWPTRKCCSRTRRSPSSSPTTATSPPTRPNWSRSNTRRCPSSSIPSRRWTPTRRCCARISRARPTGAHGAAQAPQSHLHLGGRRQGRHRRRLPQRRGHGQGADLLSAHASVARWRPASASPRFDKIKGELTVWGTFQAPHVVRTVAALIADDSRAQDPRDLARYRRRLRQQGRRLSRLYLRGRRLDRHRQAGEMGRGPHREPVRHRRSPATIT